MHWCFKVSILNKNRFCSYSLQNYKMPNKGYVNKFSNEFNDSVIGTTDKIKHCKVSEKTSESIAKVQRCGIQNNTIKL